MNHIHGPSNFRSTSDEARPEIGFLPAGWRALKNTEGRIYYMEEHGKRFTFDKPQVPNALPPGWTSMLDDKGKPYYLDHNTRSSTYVSPVYGIAPVGYELRQTDTGRLYYVNRKTQAATWHKPLPINEKLPAGWEAGQHADGRIYYINHLAKTTQWTKPTSPARAPAQTGQPVRHAAPASHQAHQAIPIRPSAGPTSAPAGSATRPAGHPQNSAPPPGQPAPHTAPHHANPTAASIGHATAGPRPGAPPHRPATTTSAGPAPGTQHTAPAPHTTAPAPRPLMPHKIASAPAASSHSANMRSSLNALAHNQKAQKVALGLGLSVFKAAVAPDLNLGNTDFSNIDFGNTDFGSTGTGSTDLSSMDFSSTDVGNILGDSSITQPQDSDLGPSFDPTTMQSNDVLVVQESDADTQSCFVPADTSQTQTNNITDGLSPASTSAISPPLMSPTGWTDPSNTDGSYVQGQGQAGYGIVPFMGNQSSQQHHNAVTQNAQHLISALQNTQHHNAATHNAQQHQKPNYNAQHHTATMQNTHQHNNGSHNAPHHSATTQNTQQYNDGPHNAQHHNPAAHNAHHPGNKPTGGQNSSSYQQQDYQLVNDPNTVVYTTDGTDDQNYIVNQTETVDITDTYDSQGAETTYVDTTTYTVQDDGSTDTVDYSFVSSQDYSSNC